jgi:sugar lactone lactonase YvrE
MPWGITVDELGDVYVVDWRNDRVQKFGADGEFIFALGESGNGDGEFNRPTGIEVDRDGDIYVADCGNDRVQLFSADGRYIEQFIGDASLSKSARQYLMSNPIPLRLREMAKLEPQKRFRAPVSVTVDGEGRMYVTDSRSYRVQVYQKDAIPLERSDIAPPVRSPTLQST